LILCATQRSGSSMMVDDILRVAGRRPADGEILRSALLTTEPRRSYPMHDWNTAWTLACRRNRLQSIILLKVMFHYVPYLSASIRGESPVDRGPIVEFRPAEWDAFHEFFRDAFWIAVERQDVYAQAVSMYLAETTGVWERRRVSPPAPPAPPPPYNRMRLKRFLLQFSRERSQWPRVFEHYGIRPLQLRYEDAVDNYPGYLNELFAITGLARAPRLRERRILKVATPTNECYVRQLREEATASGWLNAGE
jgi:LPS sulfotransferase NodH